MTKDRFTVREVAERYEVSEDTVRAWIRGKSLEAIDIGSGGRKIYRITSDALRKFEKRPSARKPA